jgi:Flp pilus assembly protein TadG
MMPPLRRRDRRRSRGQSLVEFALVFPLFMLLVFGLVDLGRLVYANNALAEAAREGARWGSVQARSALALDAIETYTVDRIAGIGGVTATATCIKPAGDTQPCSQFDTLQVTTEGSFGLITPVIGQLMSVAGLNPFDVEATAQVIVNN